MLHGNLRNWIGVTLTVLMFCMVFTLGGADVGGVAHADRLDSEQGGNSNRMVTLVLFAVIAVLIFLLLQRGGRGMGGLIVLFPLLFLLSWAFSMWLPLLFLAIPVIGWTKSPGSRSRGKGVPRPLPRPTPPSTSAPPRYYGSGPPREYSAPVTRGTIVVNPPKAKKHRKHDGGKRGTRLTYRD